AAAGLHHQPHNAARFQIEEASLDQIAVHHRIEIGIVDHIVHMAVDVIVHPAGRNQQKMPIIGAPAKRLAQLRFAHCPIRLSTPKRRPIATMTATARANPACRQLTLSPSSRTEPASVTKGCKSWSCPVRATPARASPEFQKKKPRNWLIIER